MLRTNLSTRPFYNERAVHLVLVVLALGALTVLVAGGLRLTGLLSEQTVLTEAAELDERRAGEIRDDAVLLQRDAGSGVLEGLEEATHEANQLIDQRMFSWTQFFNRIEATLPADVMLTSLRPEINDRVIEVAIGIVGRDVEAIDHFIGQLEATGAFSSVLSREEEMTDGGAYRAVLLGQYRPLPLDPSQAIRDVSLVPESAQ